MYCPVHFGAQLPAHFTLQKELPKFSVEKKFHFLVIYVA